MADLISAPGRVVLVQGGGPVSAPQNIVYSTAPRFYQSEDGIDYVVKGPDVEVVAAEAVAYILARAIHVRVPDCGIAEIEGAFYFASQVENAALRDPEPFLGKFLSTVAELVVLDTWIVNDDRNLGSLLALPDALVSIDFEKAKAIRCRYPLVQTPTVEPKTLWPQGLLGTRLRGEHVPSRFVGRIQALPDATIVAAALGVATLLPAYDWAERTVEVLKRRRDNLVKLVQDVWS